MLFYLYFIFVSLVIRIVPLCGNCILSLLVSFALSTGKRMLLSFTILHTFHGQDMKLMLAIFHHGIEVIISFLIHLWKNKRYMYMVLFSYKKGPTADVCESIMGMTVTEDTMFLTRDGMEVEFNGKLPNMTSLSSDRHIQISFCVYLPMNYQDAATGSIKRCRSLNLQIILILNTIF